MRIVSEYHEVFGKHRARPHEPLTKEVRAARLLAREAGRRAGRIYLGAAFEERHRAKREGAKWDPDGACWYVHEGDDSVERLIEIFGVRDF